MPIDIARNNIFVEEAIAADPNKLVVWYLMASYAYYMRHKNIISDDLYDRICFLLAEELDAVNIDHQHAHLIDIGALSAGTGYHISRYPQITISVAEGFISGRYP